jgi:hypothetical protein
VECIDWRKAKESTCANRVSLHKNNNNNKGRQLPDGPSSDVSFRLDQKTGNFKVAFDSRDVQWSSLTEEKQMNQLAQKDLRIIKTIIIIKAGAITSCFSPPNQRWTEVKDGKLQGGVLEQTNAVEFLDWRKAKESACASRISDHKNNNNVKGGGNYRTVIASTSALHCSKRRQTSRWPVRADQCSGVHLLRKSKRINLPHENEENTRGAEGHMAKHRSAVSVFRRIQNVGSAFNTVGSSSLLDNERRGALDAAAAMRGNGPENQPAFAALSSRHPVSHAPLSTQPSAASS